MGDQPCSTYARAAPAYGPVTSHHPPPGGAPAVRSARAAAILSGSGGLPLWALAKLITARLVSGSRATRALLRNRCSGALTWPFWTFSAPAYRTWLRCAIPEVCAYVLGPWERLGTNTGNHHQDRLGHATRSPPDSGAIPWKWTEDGEAHLNRDHGYGPDLLGGCLQLEVSRH